MLAFTTSLLHVASKVGQEVAIQVSGIAYRIHRLVFPTELDSARPRLPIRIAVGTFVLARYSGLRASSPKRSPFLRRFPCLLGMPSVLSGRFINRNAKNSRKYP